MKTKRPLRFEYWKSAKNKQWYWRIRAGNGEPVAQGEGYKKSKRGVLKVFHLLFDFEAAPECVELNQKTLPPMKPKHFEGKLNRNWP